MGSPWNHSGVNLGLLLDCFALKTKNVIAEIYRQLAHKSKLSGRNCLLRVTRFRLCQCDERKSVLQTCKLLVATGKSLKFKMKKSDNLFAMHTNLRFFENELSIHHKKNLQNYKK